MVNVITAVRDDDAAPRHVRSAYAILVSGRGSHVASRIAVDDSRRCYCYDPLSFRLGACGVADSDFDFICRRAMHLHPATGNSIVRGASRRSVDRWTSELICTIAIILAVSGTAFPLAAAAKMPCASYVRRARTEPGCFIELLDTQQSDAPAVHPIALAHDSAAPMMMSHTGSLTS
jgi:hypothetical protein